MATRDLSPSELILTDPAAVVGPDGDTEPVCLEVRRLQRCTKIVIIIGIRERGGEGKEGFRGVWLSCLQGGGYKIPPPPDIYVLQIN